MTQYVIDIGAVPDDGQGDPLRTAFAFTNDNFNQIFESGPVGSNVKIANNTITTTVINSNLILSPSGIGKIQVNNTLLPRIDNVYDLGSLSQRFNTIYVGSGGLDITGGIIVSGNITADYFIGNGSALTGIVATTGSRVENGNSNINIPAAGSNIFVTVNGTGNIVVFSNTGAYVAGEVSATGNITGNYILGNGALLTGINANYGNANVAAYLPTYTGNLVSLTGPVTTTSNVTGGNIRTNGQITATGNITGGNVDTGRVNAANITVSGPVSASGNISGAYFLGDGSQLTNLPAGNYSNANVAAYLPTYTGNLVSLTGPVTTTANITGGNLITNGQATVTGNITAGNVDTSRVNAVTATVSGSISAGGNITGNNLIGNTVIGTTVAATANVVGGNITTAGQISSTGNIQGGNLNVPGGTVSSLTVSAAGNIRGGNIVTPGFITATGNITGGNVDTGNIHAGNVNVDSVVRAQGNVYGNTFVGNGLAIYGNASLGNISVAGNIGASTVSAAGNIIGGNLLTTGKVSAVGNVSGNYFVGNGALLTGITVSAGSSLLNGNSNVVVATNGNVTVGVSGTSNVAQFSNTGAYVTGVVSATGNITGSYLLGNGAFITGVVAASVDANALIGNTLSSNVLYSSLTQTGTLTNLSVSGNISTGNILTNNYYYANGMPVPPGVIYTANIAPPVTPAPKVTDQWYDTANDVLYEYLDDGTSTYWIDTTSPAFAGGVVANVAISGTLVPVANVTYDIGTSTVYFRNTYTQNLYTNNRLPAYNMPVGAVVQTVMSSSLGGSITNSTSYADISYANVTITPSSTTSKILILATGTSSFTSLTGQDITANTQLVRNPSTSLQIQPCGTTISGGGIGVTGSVSYSYIDSPGTMSPVTYKLQQKISNASSTLTSTNIWLIAMEITSL
jgi:hypothetical protein